MAEPKKLARLFVVATVGAAIGFVTYELVYRAMSALFALSPALADHTATLAPVAWLTSFAIGVARQHALHRRFTFREAGVADAPYWPSLARAYRHYAVVAACGALLNLGLTTAGVPHRLAWLACLALTATFGALFLEKSVFRR